MSTGRTARGAYRVAPSREAQSQWTQLALLERGLIEEHLEDIAWTVGLRQWVSEEEADEPFELLVAGYKVTYRLEPHARTLRVTGLTRGK
jgi:hypothetical protein